MGNSKNTHLIIGNGFNLALKDEKKGCLFSFIASCSGLAPSLTNTGKIKRKVKGYIHYLLEQIHELRMKKVDPKTFYRIVLIETNYRIL